MSLVLKQRLGVFGFQAQPVKVDLNPGVNIHGIYGRLTARVDIVGGAADGTLLTEGVERLISTFRIRHDGDDRVGLLDGRQLQAITTAARQSIEPPVNIASGAIQADTNISFDFYLPIALPYLAQPALTCWPGTMPVRTELAIYFEWNQARAGNVASSLGSGALVGGAFDRTLTFDQGPVLELYQLYSTGEVTPWYLTRYTPRTTDQFAAANPQLPFLLNGNRRIAANLVRALQGANQDKADLISDISLIAGNGALRYYDRLGFVTAQREYQGFFPAFDDLVNAEKTGQWFASFADSGLLGTVLDPRPLSLPQYQFNVTLPGAAALLDIVLVELDVLPGVTAMTS